MRRFFGYWLESVRLAARGNSSAANDWQWVFANPLWQSIGSAAGAVLGAFVTATLGSAPVMLPETPVGIFLGGLFGFVVTWLAFFIVRFLNAPVVRFFAEKERADGAVCELAEKTTPRFLVSFDPERGGITTEMEQKGTQAKCVRISVDAISDRSIQGCTAYVTGLEKRPKSGDAFNQIKLPASVQFVRQFEVMPRIHHAVEFIRAREEDNKLAPISDWSNALANAFNDAATYRFTIAVNGEGVTATPIKVDIVWDGAWDQITGYQVQEA